ncbi:MAG: hypothetical protein Q8876_07350 [Bacillota bacterium]|nr:hypothetical protein [Bacillota bacterium]
MEVIEMIENENTSLVVVDQDEKLIADLTQKRTTAFCSFEAKSIADKAKLYTAMNNPDFRIGDEINTVIKAKDVFAEIVTCTNRDTGEQSTCPRVVIIDDKGKGHQAVSMGVFSAVKKLMQVYGLPTWTEPLPLKVLQITKGDRKLLTFAVDIKG